MIKKSYNKVYNPQKIENKIYKIWERGKYFTPKINIMRKPFTIVIPPPNVTGNLHMGHALNNTIQDILIRWHRMKNSPTLWLPGTDHAGIATQNVVEQELDSEGKNRYDLGREKFIKYTWQWVEKYGGNIENQLRRLGASCDWTRKRFTLDEGLSEAVKEAFIRLHKKGLIYQGDRIINWCPRCVTVLSDLEVEYEEEKSSLWYIRYPIVNSKRCENQRFYKVKSPKFIIVATTRPETMLGDTAVAVHPRDKRYKKLIGKTVNLPLMGREIPIITDEAVDPKFGTGAVKVTPAHDPTDYEIAQRHNLPQVKIIDQEGKMTPKAGKFSGLDLMICRDIVVRELKKQGLLEKIKDYTHSVGKCYRCKKTVEPLVSKQWFVKIKPLAKPAIVAVKKDKIKFIPYRFTKIYLGWMENIQDWCISRQLWWGHQLPVYYCRQEEIKNKKLKRKKKGCGKIIVSKERPKRCPKCGSSKLTQDPDVLDTWFSSALWPFSTLGWPKKTKDLQYFYPTSVLVTAPDIIFFWVARMIMMGLEFTGKVPFHIVHLHGLVRDEKGRKMSKSEGNVIDPLNLIDKYSADSLRMALVCGIAPGSDVAISDQKVKGYRNFSNKIWNAFRFILLNLDKLSSEEKKELKKLIEKENFKKGLEKEDKEILKKLEKLSKKVETSLEKYRFSDAALACYHFFWHHFCDIYIEKTKPRLQKEGKDRVLALAVLVYILQINLKLLHPFMPYVTEHIWQTLGDSELADKKPLLIQNWPVK